MWQAADSTLVAQIADQVGIALAQADLLAQEQGQRAQLAHQNLQLEASRQQAEQALQAKSIFLATMSHEIRTPINALLGMSDILKQTSLTPDQRECLTTIQSGGTTLLHLIEQILDFSTLEAGSVELQPHPFDLRVCLDDILESFASLAQAKQLELNGIMPPSVPTQLWGDEVRLKQILFNLVSNAIKFTDQGEVYVEVFVVSDRDPVVQICFAVVDTGIGIGPAQQSQLFLPFHQLDRSSTRKYGGIGLGLAITQQLVALMQGTLEYSSQAGSGSQFWITLPLEKLSITLPQRDLSSQDQLEMELLSTFKQVPFILIDNHDTTRKALTYLLEPLSNQIQATSDMSSGLTSLRGLYQNNSEARAIVLLNQDQLEVKTRKLLLQCQADPVLKQANYILMSLNSISPDLKAFGFSQLLLKPVTQKQLWKCLQACLHQARHPQRPTVAPSPPASPRVLLVEDNLINQKLAIRQLKSLNYSVEAANHGQEALQLLATNTYDLILMDCQMPVLDGYDTTRAIRAIEGDRHHTVIIAVTANAMAEDREMCLAAGMDDYLSKPVSTEKLSETLAYWLPGTAAAHPVSERSGQVIDNDQLRQMSGGDVAFEIELIQVFLEDSVPQIAVAQTALIEHNWVSLQQLAHRLKGASASIGAIQISQTAQEIERLATQHDPSAAGLIEQLQTHLQDLEHVLDSLLAKLTD